MVAGRKVAVVVTSLPFVVLHHTGHGEPHFDLMLATDDAGPLLTWRLSDWPPGPTTRVTPLPPHRRVYLHYEGDVSGGRGEVRRVAAGVYDCRQRDDGGDVWLVDVAGHTVRLPESQSPA